MVADEWAGPRGRSRGRGRVDGRQFAWIQRDFVTKNAAGDRGAWLRLSSPVVGCGRVEIGPGASRSLCRGR